MLFIMKKLVLLLCVLCIGCTQVEETPLCGVWKPINEDIIGNSFDLLDLKQISFNSGNRGKFIFRTLEEQFNYSFNDKLTISYYYLDFSDFSFKTVVHSFNTYVVDEDVFFISKDGKTYIYNKVIE